MNRAAKLILAFAATTTVVACSKPNEATQQTQVQQAEKSPYEGKISYKDARAFYDILKPVVNNSALFYKIPFQERLAFIKEARETADKAEKIFGIPSSCYSAGHGRAEYLQALHDYASSIERNGTKQPFHSQAALMRAAFEFGEAVAWCYQEVELLDKK